MLFRSKNNKKIVKKLLLVVIDDIEYEISSTIDYVNHLNDELKRCKQIEKYIEKKNNAKKESDVLYFEQYINMLLRPGEKLENFDTIHEEFQKAYDLRNEVLVGLRQEIKNVKSLKV